MSDAKGPQITVAMWERTQPNEGELESPAELTVEYIVSLLRVLARKEPGDVFTGAEREACRNALHAIKRNW